MSYSWYRTGTCSVVNGNARVNFQKASITTAATKPVIGDAFTIDNSDLYEVIFIGSDSTGEYVMLDRNFEQPSAQNVKYAFMRLASSTQNAKLVAMAAEAINQKQISLEDMHEWYTLQQDEVEFTQVDGTTVKIPTWYKFNNDLGAVGPHLTDIETVADNIDAVKAAPAAAQTATEKAAIATSKATEASDSATAAANSAGIAAASNMLMTEAEAMAMADAYDNIFAASGMVHMGCHYVASGDKGVPINEGMWVRGTEPNRIFLGRDSASASNVYGTSESKFPVTYIAGAVAGILKGSNHDAFTVELPQAEAGTRVYDSTGNVRGSGKATLDFRFDQDPKYGDVPTGTEAEILREAVGRAFEGDVKNGDFRGGTNDWVAQAGATLTVTDGVATLTTDSSSEGMTGSIPTVAANPTTVDVEFTMKIAVGDAYSFGIWNPTDGNQLTDAVGTGEIETYKATITITGVSSNIRVYHRTGGAGTTAEIHNVSLRPATEEVVTHRSDLATWESYDEELTGRTEVMECIQSLSTTFGDTDVPTVLSTRPNSYFDQYDGQSADPDAQNTKYRCVVWDDLTDEQKRKVAAYMGNKLYVGENGNLVNRRLRARTFRGLGNGDWRNTNANTDNEYLQFDVNNRIKPQGALDAPRPLSGSFPVYPATRYGNQNGLPHSGIFSASNGSSGQLYTDAAYKGRCFLYVVASVPRLNKGTYHEKLNPFGTGDQINTAQNGWVYWHSSSAQKAYVTAQCFAPYIAGQTYGLRDSAGTVGSIKGGDQYTGRPDGKFFDGITAGGLNGVIDWRLPAIANDTPEEQSKVQGKVENKTFRGLQKLVWTHMQTASQGATSGSTSAFDGLDTSLISVGDTAYLENYSGNYEKVTVTQSFSNGTISFAPTIAGRKVDSKAVLTTELNLSVSGEFNTSMVIGDPANILQTDALKYGWLGTWCPVIPDSAIDQFPLTRKTLDSGNVNLQFTVDNGVTWTDVSSSGINNVNNEITLNNWASTSVSIANYTAYAKVTEPCENKAVYNGKKGLMPVFASSYHQDVTGALFAESLLGKVLKSSVRTGFRNYEVESFALNGGLIWGDGLELPVHTPISLASPNNDSPAVKVLPYQIAENEQCFIGYQANELTWDAAKSVGSAFSSIDGETSPTYVEGTLVHITEGAFTGRYRALRNLSGYGKFNDNRWMRLPNGNIAWCSSGAMTEVLEVWDGSGWGDDGKIKVTADGSDTFVDLNGNTNLSVSHKTTMPTGWTKNRARIGEQVSGVDL